MTFPSKVQLSAVLTTTALALTCMGFGQDAKLSFSISISGPNTVKVGSSARIDISLVNTSNRTITLSRGDNTDAELNFAFNIDIRDSDGKPATPTGAWPLSGKLAWVDLKPHEMLKAGADIGKLFDLKPGKYSIQLSRSEGADRILPHKSGSVDLQQHETAQPAQSQPVAPIGSIVKSNTITVTVIP